MFTNIPQSSPPTNTTFLHEMSPFQMGNFYLPHPPNIYPPNPPIYPPQAEPGSPKRDRHTKIWTAQGVRDRRVRLSMAIAREFFDLQDMLGFDRASKTLGWLMAKSKGAIHELALEKKGSLPRGTSKCCCGCKRGRSGISQGGCIRVLREKREKARARARERTREKLTSQGVNLTRVVSGGASVVKGGQDLTSLVSSTGYDQNHLDAQGGDHGWNLINFPKW